MPEVLEEPADVFVVRNRLTKLSCKFSHALNVFIKCNDQPMRDERHERMEFVDPSSGVRITDVSVNLTRRDVETVFADYFCECIAWNSQGTTRSRKASVTLGCKSYTSKPKGVLFLT